MSGTNGVSPAWPTHQVGDIALLFMETRGNVTPTLTTAAGFVSVGSNNAVNSAAGTRLTVYWARASSSSMAAPVIANTTDHVYAQILTYRGVLWSGNPWSVTATGNKTTASLTVSVIGVTPTDTNSLVVQAVTRPNDSAAAAFSNQINVNLTGITERTDGGTTVGDGGGFAVWDGVRAPNTATGNTTSDVTPSVVNAFRALALRPAKYYSRVATGNWNTAATWSTIDCDQVANSVVPPAGADVTICPGHTITLNANSANLNSLTIQATGVLNIGVVGTARTLTVSPAAPLPPGSIVNSGTLRYNTGTITTNGTFTNNGTFTSLAVAGGKTLTVTGLITNSNTGIFRFAGGAAMTVNANGGFTNDGTLDVDAASNFTHTLNMRGNFVNNNSVNFRADANSLVTTVFNATAAQTVTGSVANTNFYNVTVTNANGVTLTGTHNMTVLNTLSFTSDGSIITTGNNLVQIGSQPLNLVGSVTGANANRFVNGNLQRYFNAAGIFDFEVGSIVPNRRSPVQVRIGGALSTAGSLRVSTASGDHAQIGSSGFDAAKTVNRTWTLTNAGLVFGANANNRVRFTFVASDIDSVPAPAVPANFHIGRYTGSWTLTPPPTPNAQPLFTEMSGTTITSATLTGDFQVGEKPPVVTAPDSFNAVEVAAAINGRIFTKLRSANFTLDIVAVQGGVLHGSFNGAVDADLMANAAAGNCAGGAAIGSTSQSVNLASGRGTTGAFNVATAYPNARVRIQYPAGGPYTVTTCSSDNFSIKPTAFSITSLVATNLTTGVGTTIKTGANFDLIAAGGAGYTGTPSTNFTGNVQGTPAAGTLGGAFSPAVSGSASGSFFYGEVGHFGLLVDAVQDTAFTNASGDPGGNDCIASSTSDALSGGKYGCWVGSNAVAGVTGLGFGRFIPDNFNVTYPTPPIFGTVCGTFTYVGSSFTYPSSAVMRVTARNGTNNGLLNATTTNYAGAYMKLANSINSLNQPPYNSQTARYTNFDALGGGNTPALVPSGLPATTADPSIANFASGVVDLTFSAGTGTFSFTRSTATPSAAFNADIALALNIIDSDNVVFATNPASFGTATSGGGISFSGGKMMRYGRLRLSNANGSQLVPLAMLMETQYWNGSSFITNADDNCTSLGTANVGLGNYTPNLDAGETTASIAAGNFSKGRKMLTLSPPGAANNGGVEVVLNLGTTTTIDTCPAWSPSTPAPAAGNLTHLRGRWCGATHTKDPTARARFGVFRGSEEVIHNRENF